MGYMKLEAKDIRKIRELKAKGFKNRDIQNKLGYSLSTISKYTSKRYITNGGLNIYYSVNPGFTRRSPVDEEIIDIRRRIHTQESDPGYLNEAKEYWVDVSGPVSEQEYSELRMMHTIETLRNNNKMKELEDRIEELEETINDLTKKLQDPGNNTKLTG